MNPPTPETTCGNGAGKSAPVELPAGRVTAIRGSVVEVDFERGLPAINEALRIRLSDRPIVLEVAHHLDLRTVRAISMTHTDGVARGMAVERTGQPLLVPVGPRTLGRLFNALGHPLDGGDPLDDAEHRPIQIG